MIQAEIECVGLWISCRLLVWFRWLIAVLGTFFHLPLCLFCLRKKGFNRLLDGIKSSLQGGGCLFASLQFFERLAQILGLVDKYLPETIPAQDRLLHAIQHSFGFARST